MGKTPGVRFQIDSESALSPRKQIQEQLVNYVHLGLLRMGMRLPTVRDLAAQTSLNLKTAFRIYRGLARDGLVEIRPQHGVFVKCSPRAASRSHQSGVTRFLRRMLREARQYNLSPLRVAHLLAAEAGAKNGRPLRCAVLECNREQVRVFSRELGRRLGVDAFPVLTTSSSKQREAALRRADVLVTTDFHWDEVTSWAARQHKEVFRIRLNPAFFHMLVENARKGLFPMVLSDVWYVPRFQKTLKTLMPPELVDRLVPVHYRNRAELKRLFGEARRAYVSPLCYVEVVRQAPKGVTLLTLEHMISNDSLNAIQRSLVGKETSRN